LRIVDTALDGERERHDREEEKKAQHEAQERQITVRMCAINVHGGASVCCPAEIITSANGEGFLGNRSVELELKLDVVAAALSGVTRERNYPPVLACEDGFEVAIEQLSLGRRDFQPECIVAGTHDLASEIPRRVRNEAGQ
jgi:hypothetical protein